QKSSSLSLFPNPTWTISLFFSGRRRQQHRRKVVDRPKNIPNSIKGTLTLHLRSEVPKVGLCSLPLRLLTTQPTTFGGHVQISPVKSAVFICAAASNARMGAEQTQTVTRQSSTITIAPIQGIHA
ncbi:hypothetical protein M8C21_013703, partial [Ambrosia artemisiifolia]